MRLHQIMLFWDVTPCRLVSAYDMTRSHNLEAQNFNNIYHENLKTYIRPTVNGSYLL
jgi:hypothetical protein